MDFVFETSKENDVVRICVKADSDTICLGRRKHNNTIFLLAKQRAKDLLSKVPTSKQGWLYKDWLAEQLFEGGQELADADFSLVNQHFSRFKQMLNQKMPSQSFEDLVEHRTCENEPQVRFTPDRIVIIEDNQILFDTTDSEEITESKPLVSAAIPASRSENTLIKRFSIASLFVAAIVLIGLLGMIFWGNETTAPKIQRFVFLEPVFTHESGLELDEQFQVRENIEKAVYDYAVHTANTEFVEIIFDKSADIQDLGNYYSVDFVLNADVVCTEQKSCEFTFKKHDISHHAEVDSSFNLPLTFDDEHKVYWGIYFRLDAMFQAAKNQTIAPPQGVDSSSFESFVNAYAMWQKGQLNTDTLNEVERIQKRFLNWHFAGDAFGLMLMDMHRLTEDPKYLHRLKAFASARSNYLQDSVHQAVFMAHIQQFKGDTDGALRNIEQLLQESSSIKYTQALETKKIELMAYSQDWQGVLSVLDSKRLELLSSQAANYLMSAHLHLDNVDAFNVVRQALMESHRDGTAIVRSFEECELLSLDPVERARLPKITEDTSPELIDSTTNQALTLFLQGHEDEGLALAELVNQYFPRNLNAITTLGGLQLLNGQSLRASQTFEKIFDYSHEDSSASYRIALVTAYALNNQSELAMQLYNQYVGDISRVVVPKVQLSALLFNEICAQSAAGFNSNSIQDDILSPTAIDSVRQKLEQQKENLGYCG